VEDTDRTIVRLLAADGRMSFTDLGKATGLSTSAVHQRVKRLEKRGVITGYGASVSHEELGLALTAECETRGLSINLVRGGTGGAANCLRMAPPLTISDDEVDLAAEILDASLSALPARATTS